jgi:hypothetical protein
MTTCHALEPADVGPGAASVGPAWVRLVTMSTQAEPPGGAAASTLERRVGRLEGQISALIEAVEVLARGFEDAPIAPERSEADEERAARRAHELLLLVKTTRQDTPGA